MRFFIQGLTVFSALCLMASPALAEENSGFGASLFDNRPPPALEDIPAPGPVAADTNLNAIAPAAGAEKLPADPADGAAAGNNADFIGEEDTDPAAKKPRQDIAWP